jgi:N-acetylglucosamine-6-sulfatase
MKKLMWVGMVLAVCFSAAAKDRPNILFIMSDDHTWQAVGAYNTRFSYLDPTPNLDALAAKGMVFENAFCGNSICTPSRASIMTGQYSHRNGALTLNGALEKERQYLALEMKTAGYQTAIVGKWHLKALPEAFDYYKVLPGQGKYFNPVFRETGKDDLIKMEGHSTDCVMDSALAWFKDKRDPDRPFFLKLHFKAPHDYFENAPRYDSYLEHINMPEPLSLWERGTGSLGTRGHEGELDRVMATSIGRRNFRRSYDVDFEVDPELDDTAAKREAYNIYMKKYFRCVKGVDDNLGRLFEYMEQEELMKNTLILYTGDQGFFLGEHDMQDKRWAYEPSFRMPLIAYYPETIEAGSRTDAIVENVDYPVTMLDYAGIKLPDYMQGRSFRKVLDKGEEPKGWKQEAYYQYWMHMAHHDVPGHIAMRTKRYKLILFHGTQGTKGFGSKRSEHRTPPAWELYDLEKDPHERVNVYDDPAYADTVAELKPRFRELRARIGADDPSIAPTKAAQARIAAVNKVIDEYWDYSPEDRQKAVRISREYYEKFGNPETCEKYLAPWLRPDALDPSEM